MNFNDRKKNFIEICKAIALDDNPSVYETPNKVVVGTKRRGVPLEDCLSYNPSNKTSMISTIGYSPTMDPDDEVVKVHISKEDENGFDIPTRWTTLYLDGTVEVIDNGRQEIIKRLTEKQMYYYLKRIQEHLDRNSKLLKSETKI